MNQLSNLLYHRDHVLLMIRRDSTKIGPDDYDHILNELIILAMKLGSQIHEGGLTR